MKERVLFVTREDENFRDGFSYALELSKIVEGGMHVLFYHDGDVLKRFEDDMAAAALAEAGDLEAARGILKEADEVCRAEAGAKVAQLRQQCSDPALVVDFGTASGDLISAIRTVLQERSSVEMVILSPSLMDSGKTISFKKLRRYITKPIVTMSRPVRA